MDDEPIEHDPAIRVILHQPALPRYRLPVFVELSERPGIQLSIRYGKKASLPNEHPEALRAEEVSIRELRTPAGPLYFSTSQWSGIDRTCCDAVVLSWDTRYLSLVPALLIARARGLASLLWGHGYSKHESRLRRWLRDVVARLATAVILYDTRAERDYRQRSRRPVRSFVAQNTLDVQSIFEAREHWLSEPQRLDDFAKERNLDIGPVMVFVARLNQSKRLDVVISAMALLSSEYPYLKLVVIGEGQQTRMELEEQALQLGVSERVLFLGAVYEELALAPWFLASDAMVIPAEIGLSAMTALAFGTPVVVNDNGAHNNPEWNAIEPGINGLRFSEGDPESLAETLRVLFGSPDLQRRLGEGAIETMRSRYTLEAMVDGFEAAIRYCASTVRQARGSDT